MADQPFEPNGEHEGKEYNRLLAKARGYLPFMMIIISSENLEIQNEHKEKLRSLYAMVDAQRLSATKLKSCEKVFYSLFTKYHKLLSEEQLRALQNTQRNIPSSNEGSNDHASRLSEKQLIPTENDQTPKSNFESPIKMISLKDTENKNLDEKKISQESDDKQNEESTLENSVNEAPFCDQNSKDNSMSSANFGASDMCESVDKSQQMGELIGFTIRKLDESDIITTGTPSAEIAKQLFNENTAFYNSLLKNVDMDCMKKALSNLKCSKDSVSPRDTVENNTLPILPPEPPRHVSGFVASESSKVQEKSNSERSTVSKTVSSDKPKLKVVSSLKPGTLRDLENTKLISSSLHIESLRPVVKSNDTFKPVAITNVKNTNSLLHVNDMTSRDPRQKTCLPLSSNNILKSIHLSLPTNPQVQTPVPAMQNHDSNLNLTRTPMTMTSPPQSPHVLPMVITPPPPLLSPTPVVIKSSLPQLRQEIIPHCSRNTSFPQHELPHSALLGYNKSTKPISCPSSNMPVFEKLFNKNSNPSAQNQYRHNRNEINYDTPHVNQCPYSYQPYVNSSHFDETRYRQSESNNQNGRFPIRDPRLAKSDQKSFEPCFRSYKEFRLAKHGREKSPYRGSASGVHELNRFRSRTLEKDDLRFSNKKKTNVENNRRLSNVEIVLDKAKSIKDFKIPKLKRKDEVADNDKHKGFEIDKVSDNTAKYRCGTIKNSFADKFKKPETITDQSKNFVSIKDSSTKHFRKTETIMDRVHTEKRVITDAMKNINSEVKKTLENNYDKEKEFQLETKSKKPKKYSKEREFEKIVKEAVASSKDGDVHGPRTRTRNSMMKKDETLKNNDLNATKQNDNGQNPVLDELNESSSKWPDYESCQNTENDISETLETGQNVITSTSKEPFEADCSTEVVCSKSQEKKSVASSEINSTADVQSGDDNRRALDELMNIIKAGGAKKLVDLLKSPHFDSIIKSKPSGNYSNEPQKKLKKKKKDKKNKKKLKKYSSDENERRNESASSLDENNSDPGSAEYQTEEVKSCTNDSNHENDLNSDSNSECSSTGSVKYKSKKDKNYQPYRNFAILKDKSKVELKDLKIVIPKFDNKSGNEYSANNQPVKVLLQNEPDNKTQSEVSNSGFESTGPTISKQKAKLGSKQVKKKISSESNKCNVSLKPAEMPSVVCNLKNTSETVKASEETQSINQNETEMTVTDTNLSIKSRNMKKPRSKTSELDKLHAYTSGMYDCNAILNVSNVRHCRMNKQIDYVNTGTVFPKKSNVANVQSDSSCDRRNDTFDQNIEKPKSNKNVSKLSTFKINKNKKVKKTTVLKKSLNVLLPTSKNKSKSRKKTKFTKKQAQLNAVPDKKMVPEVLPKIVSKIDFVDKLYFQSRDILLECKLCHYSNTSLNVVRHYKEQHCEEEVLPSRLSKDCAESLINESLKNNFGLFNSEDLKSTTYGSSINTLFMCVFCECIIDGIVQFFDHLTSHTGEYRYKCKMCEKVYSCENELENHVLDHSEYDKTDGISLLLHPNPIEKVFGYLCPFCYYVQISYDNLVKHMELRHVDEDKKYNGRWTVIRVYLSLVNDDESYNNSAIDYANLVGCLPPSLPLQPNHQVCQTISKIIDPVDKTPIAQLVVEARMNLIGGNAEHILFDKPPQEIQNVVSDLSIEKASSSSHEKKSKTSEFNFELEYIMKGNCQMCTVAELSCCLADAGQVLMFKCCVSMCLGRAYSTVDLREFVKHIEQNHEHTVWDGKCSTCELKVEKISDECLLVKDALKHMIAHHLALKECEDLNTCLVENSVEEQNISPTFLYNNQNIEIKKKTLSKPSIRCVPIDSMVSCPFSVDIPENAYSTVTNDGSSINEIPNHLNLNNCNIKAEPIGEENMSMNEALSCPNSNDLIEVTVNDSLSITQVPSVPTSNDDRGSTVDEQFALGTTNETSEQFSHIATNSTVEEFSVIETGADQPTNYTGPIKIDSIMSLREEKVKKKRIPKVTSPIGNIALNKPLPITQTLNKLAILRLYLKPGQFVVNGRTSIDDSQDYKLIDTTYEKCYGTKLKYFLTKPMKTRTAFTEMMKVLKLLSLFKCMDKSCTKVFNQKDLFKLHMKLHFSNAEKKNRVQIKNPEYFSKCAYCFRMFDDEESLANHIAEQYTHCKYFCPYCFYLSYRPTHLLSHLHQFHPNNKKRIIELGYDENNVESCKEVLKVVDYNEFVLPYICSIGSCKFSCFLTEDFTYHITLEHQNCDKYSCYLCERKESVFFASQPHEMIDHLKIHNIAHLQCIYCLFGTENLNVLAVHLANEHFEYEPLFLERTHREYSSDDKNDIVNLKIVSLTMPIENGIIETILLPPGTTCEILPQKSKKRDFERSDFVTAAMKSANINESALSSSADPILITIPASPQLTDSTCNVPEDNEFIMLDDASKINDELGTTKVDSSEKSMRNLPQSYDVDDVIIIEDNDDDVSLNSLSNNEETTSTGFPTKQKRSANKSCNGLKKFKRLALPVVPLDDLFFCKSCNINLQNGEGYIQHLSICEYLELNGHKCPFCTKNYQDNSQITEHIMLHGPDRFKCSSCDFKAPSKRAIQHHMRVVHDMEHLDFVPIFAELNDHDKHNFIVYRDLTKSKNYYTKTLYTCALCKLSKCSYFDIESHMTIFHSIKKYEMHVLSDSSPSNDFTQEYLVKPITSVELSNPLEQCASAKRKRSGDHSGNGSKKKIPGEANTLDTLNNKAIPQQSMTMFSPETIDNIPLAHILKEPVGCSLCSFNTKVRSNLICHLNGHKIGQKEIDKEFTNPVPSMGKSEKMFDKMINLSASSYEAMNIEKMKIDELNKKIVEVVAPLNCLNIGAYPEFVSKDKRYKCPIIKACSNYLTKNSDMLKTHISILHTKFTSFKCPHCSYMPLNVKNLDLNKLEHHLMLHGENLYRCQYCDYIDFNRTEMRVHMRMKHLQQVSSAHSSNIIVIRQTMLEDEILERNAFYDQSCETEWLCNLCSSGIKYTLNEIKSHVFVVHKVAKMYKCPLCHFEHDDNNGKVFEDHYKIEHPTVAAQCCTVYEKVANIKEQLNQLNYIPSTPNLVEQALESIEPSIVPPACRGIPVATKPRSNVKSPKALLKRSPVSKKKEFIDNFSPNDSIGELTPNGFYSCPKCNEFESLSLFHFRQHLYQEINYKLWKCTSCSEISDSAKKMAWHVKKKHENGENFYRRIDFPEKLKWVERVIKHQHSAKIIFNGKTNENSIKPNNPVVSKKKSLTLSLKKKNNKRKEKTLVSQATTLATTSYESPTTIDVINLLDDSDDE